ncbi:MAG: hypothetical protein JWM11_1570, partial [Planctomycetaceae bacterium]|nr:hypothetical protein [Planctomycetaceae bacterium]
MLGRIGLLFALSGIVLGIPGFCAADSSDPTEARVETRDNSRQTPIEFTRDVEPALTKAGCNAGACHGSFQGRGGFQLSLLGFDAAFDYEVLTKASRGRRLNAGIPEQSLLLQKPTGAVPHGGGRRIAANSEVAAILKEWIAQGMPGPQPSDLQGLRLTVEPPVLVIPLAKPGAATDESAAQKVGLKV